MGKLAGRENARRSSGDKLTVKLELVFVSVVCVVTVLLVVTRVVDVACKQGRKIAVRNAWRDKISSVKWHIQHWSGQRTVLVSVVSVLDVRVCDWVVRDVELEVLDWDVELGVRHCDVVTEVVGVSDVEVRV